MKKSSPASIWHDRAIERDHFACAADRHDGRCRFRAEEVHHIVFRSHLYEPAMWLLPNGIALSRYCHALAHSTHNLNISEDRLIAAVDAVNAAQPEHPRPYFTSKGFARIGKP